MNLVQSPAHVLKGLRKLHAVFGLAKHDCLLFEVLEGHLAHIGLRFLLIFAEHRGSKKDNPGMVFFAGIGSGTIPNTKKNNPQDRF